MRQALSGAADAGFNTTCSADQRRAQLPGPNALGNSRGESPTTPIGLRNANSGRDRAPRAPHAGACANLAPKVAQDVMARRLRPWASGNVLPSSLSCPRRQNRLLVEDGPFIQDVAASRPAHRGHRASAAPRQPRRHGMSCPVPWQMWPTSSSCWRIRIFERLGAEYHSAIDIVREVLCIVANCTFGALSAPGWS